VAVARALEQLLGGHDGENRQDADQGQHDRHLDESEAG
jgi:hypothetical protein